MKAIKGAEVVFTVNSPGEVSTWLAPSVRAVKRLAPELRVSAMILPCLYASGTEIDVVRRMAGVDAVIGPSESLRFILWGQRPTGWSPAGRGAVVFLGGELLLAARLGRRLQYPAAAYVERRIHAAEAFSRVFVPRQAVRDGVVQQGVPAERVVVVGDLMVDAARVPADPEERRRVGEPLGLDPDRPTVVIFPGSRPFELRGTLPLFLPAAARLAKERPDVQFVVVVSPYTTRETLAQALQDAAGDGAAARALADRLFAPVPAGANETDHAPKGDAPTAPASAASAARATQTFPDPAAPVARAVFATFHGPAELLFWRGESRAAMAAATLALTIPGSNTAELAAWGVPMVVCLPLHRPEEIPLDGFPGYLDKIPLVGRKLKAKAVLKAAERARYVALPNRIAGELIAPELRSQPLRPEEVAREAQRLLGDPASLREMGRRLSEVMGSGGAAERIARATLELLQ